MLSLHHGLINLGERVSHVSLSLRSLMPGDAAGLHKTLTLPELHRLLSAHAEDKRDIIVPLSSISLTTKNTVAIAGHGEHQIRDYAVNQLASIVGIPAVFLRNHWRTFPKQAAQDFALWRDRRIDEATEAHGKKPRQTVRLNGGQVMGVLSDRFLPYDHEDLAGDTMAALRLHDIEPESIALPLVQADDDNLRVFMHIPEQKRAIGRLPDGNPDWHFVVWTLDNGQYGSRRVRISLGVYRLVCSNGLSVAALPDLDLYSRIHLGTVDHEVVRHDIAAFFEESKTLSDRILGELDEAKTTRIENPSDVIDFYVASNRRRSFMTDEYAKAVQSAYARYPDASIFGVINAFTAAAQTLPLARESDAQDFAGELLLTPIPTVARVVA